MSILPALTLVLGGARSGKSSFAEQLCLDHCAQVKVDRAIYVATAEAGDHEMQRRIAVHRQRRGLAWQTLEEPLDLIGVISRQANPQQPILIDCLTLWLSNLMQKNRPIDQEGDDLLKVFRGRALPPVVMVSNEVGMGIVPDNKLARQFRDEAGRLNQKIAATANRVVLMAAGLPLSLKG